ncbi:MULTISPECIES: SigB/SigF/SigG family RNA polymerase sigma factor [unclassified Amycolatopsis]|uniref:SigB/SigF/SigG family RNA polymerase sigma factor n=1 Tax=unclassified Amycolatopsis TaxID=2618356 RepID=UPI002E0FD79C|nr:MULTISPECIES: SigB/SigF/SigG family RNA polymerase sigma factor [unclassified Amycolatopsis]WSJ75568.1 SigB/SigF/SigG family RNA polymerase sigma factor [Amycolatopsis sp. NBC_01307]WSK80773.1 SigB/SigF/SigG family RNA polymerase sigma factor [Amycolatopsis sp. NBC_01286]
MTDAAGSSGTGLDVSALFTHLAALPADSPERERIRDTLVRNHLELARNLARKFRNRDEAMEDLVQIATVGLIHAVDRFDPTQGTDFLAFAVPTISGELRHHFRDNSWSVRVPRRLKELNANISGAREELTVQLSRAPRPSEIAARLGVPIEDVYEGLRAGQGRYGASLDHLLENAAHTRFGAPDAELGQAELREALRPMLDSLPDRERKIVALRFGSGMSQSDIARRVGVSQMQVSRLLAATLKKLRSGLDESELADGT